MGRWCILGACVALCCCGVDASDPAAPGSGPASDGYDDPAGSGLVFFLDDYELDAAESLTWPRDINGDGTEDGALNRLSEQLEIIGYDFTEFVQSGVILGVAELAGLELPFHGDDEAVTLKIYRSQDADQDLGNNTCDGEGCAQFAVAAEYMDGDQTPYRLGPAPIAGHHLRVAADDLPDLPVRIGFDFPLPLHLVRVELVLPSALDAIDVGLVCAALPAAALDQIPVCTTTADPCEGDATVAYAIAKLTAQPDIDIDGDGLETYVVDFGGNISHCFDAPPPGGGDPVRIDGPDCLHDPRMADGFSFCSAFHGIPAALIVPGA